MRISPPQTAVLSAWHAQRPRRIPGRFRRHFRQFSNKQSPLQKPSPAAETQIQVFGCFFTANHSRSHPNPKRLFPHPGYPALIHKQNKYIRLNIKRIVTRALCSPLFMHSNVKPYSRTSHRINAFKIPDGGTLKTPVTGLHNIEFIHKLSPYFKNIHTSAQCGNSFADIPF